MPPATDGFSTGLIDRLKFRTWRSAVLILNAAAVNRCQSRAREKLKKMASGDVGRVSEWLGGQGTESNRALAINPMSQKRAERTPGRG
jgi:hypothetical protein